MLREYQSKLIADIHTGWNGGAKNVMPVLPTGGGKTKVLAAILLAYEGLSCVMAHRGQLVGQISLALAAEGVPHNIIASDKDRRIIAGMHAKIFGRVYYQPGAKVTVASVDTLIRRDLGDWPKRVGFWAIDEGHHVLKSNKWGTAVDMFPNAERGLLPTASPWRADGKGLGRHAHGVADLMVEGPTPRQLMDWGYLTRYKVAVADSHMTEYLGSVAASGDWSTAELKSASQHSQIVGDVVSSYLQHGRGGRGITFATDVDTAVNMARAYRAAGIVAEVLTGDTDPTVRRAIIERMEYGEVRQIVAVDVVSEGFDLPAIEVATLARPSASLSLVLQQCGRALRPAPGKDYAIFIDHVGNILRHGPPDKPRQWTLDAREGREETDGGEAYNICLNVECGQPYEAFYRGCPFCGTKPPARGEGEGRAGPAMVAGELSMLDDETLARLRGDYDHANESTDAMMTRLIGTGLPGRFASSTVRKHGEVLELREELREAMAALGGQWKAEGLDDGTMQRRFYMTFDMTVLEALALDRTGTEKLLTRVSNKL